MLMDDQNLLSDKQAITATANSEDIFDASVDRDLGKGNKIPVNIQVTTDFVSGGASTLTVSMETDDNASFSSAETIWTSAAIPKASLVAGYKFDIAALPRTNQRYIRLVYTVGVADFTAGNISASFGSEDQTNIKNV